MALDVQSRLDDLIGILRANTSTFAASLAASNAIALVKAGDARSLPVTIDQYPAVVVQLSRETEAFNQIGQRNNRHELEFMIAALVYQSSSAEQSDEDCRTMVKNIKSVLKTNITLSSTALFSIPETVDYFPLDMDGIYCSAAIITFRASYLST